MADLFKVTYADGRVDEVRVIPSARRAYEAEHQKTVRDAIQSGFSDWADFLVWKTLTIRHGETRTLEEWLDTVDELVLGVESPDPSSGTDRKPSASSKRRSTKAKTSTA